MMIMKYSTFYDKEKYILLNYATDKGTFYFCYGHQVLSYLTVCVVIGDRNGCASPHAFPFIQHLEADVAAPKKGLYHLKKAFMNLLMTKVPVS